MLVLSAVAAVVVIVGALAAFGLVDLSRLRSSEPSRAGLIAVPTPARVIPAYTRVRRDHLWDASRARISVIYLPPRAVTPEMLVNISDVIGRVLEGSEAAFLGSDGRVVEVAGYQHFD